MGYTNPKRTGPYRRFHDLLIDAYAAPGEPYVPTMENRPGRMPTITVDDVLSRMELWRSKYQSKA
jgi:heptosyltransferase I